MDGQKAWPCSDGLRLTSWVRSNKVSSHKLCSLLRCGRRATEVQVPRSLGQNEGMHSRLAAASIMERQYTELLLVRPDSKGLPSQLLGGLRQEDHQFKVSLGNLDAFSRNKKREGWEWRKLKSQEFLLSMCKILDLSPATWTHTCTCGHIHMPTKLAANSSILPHPTTFAHFQRHLGL